MAQLKAKRKRQGFGHSIANFDKSRSILNPPKPFLSNALNNTNRFLPQISYWVTSFGRIHRPGCSFYQRGRGELSSNPTGEDCRICGGKKGRDDQELISSINSSLDFNPTTVSESDPFL